MTANGTITLYHSPNTRSSGILLLLEELGAPYELKLLNLKAGEHRQAPFLALNPMGKVPAIEHKGVAITEQIAILIYLSDLFPETGLAPALRDPCARIVFAMDRLLCGVLRARDYRPRQESRGGASQHAPLWQL